MCANNNRKVEPYSASVIQYSSVVMCSEVKEYIIILQVVRIGHPARLVPAVVQYSLDALVVNSDSAGIILDVRHDIDKAYVRMGIACELCTCISCTYDSLKILL